MLQATRRNSASAEIHCGRPSQCVKNLLPLTPTIAVLFFCLSLYLYFSSISLLQGRHPKNAAVLLDFVQITSPSPLFGQLIQLISDVEIQDLKVSLRLEILLILYKYNFKKAV